MRFTWIALPVLYVALTGPGTTGAAALPSSDEVPDHEATTEYAASSSELPVAIMPSSSGETRLGRTETEAPSRHDGSLDHDADPLGVRSANVVRVLIRTVDRAGLAFIPEVTRATTGFLSSCTTACPPPASR
jgi:hypothetical protein